jgi:hypothetical protein
MKKLKNISVGTIASIVSYLMISSNPVDARLSQRLVGDKLVALAEPLLWSIESSTQIDRIKPKNLIAERCKDQEIRDREIGTGRAWNTCEYTLEFQLDGNLVVSKRSNRKVLWASGTAGRGTKLSVQSDGNVSIYDRSNQPIWATNTDRNPGAFLSLQNDGNLVVYAPNKRPLFATNTNQSVATTNPGIFNSTPNNSAPISNPPAKKPTFDDDVRRIMAARRAASVPATTCDADLKISTQNGKDENFSRAKQWTTCNKYNLVFQNDGNLVLYNPSSNPIWATGTEGRAVRMSVQADGNVVLYDFSNQPIWATNTTGNPGAFLSLQTDGNLIVYSRNRQPLFATSTDSGKRATTTAAQGWKR